MPTCGASAGRFFRGWGRVPTQGLIAVVAERGAPEVARQEREDAARSAANVEQALSWREAHAKKRLSLAPPDGGGLPAQAVRLGLDCPGAVGVVASGPRAHAASGRRVERLRSRA